MFCLDEQNRPVSRLQYRTAIRYMGLSVADVGTDQAFPGQLYIHQALTGDRSPFLDDDFYSFRLGTFQKRNGNDAAAAGKGQHFAGGQEPRRKDDIDADFLHEIDIFDAGHTDDGLWRQNAWQ